MLDEIGVKAGPDGTRTMPDGSELVVTLDFGAPGAREHISKNELLARDWQAIGIQARLNPVEPAGYGVAWAAGDGMSKTDWEASDGPNHLDNPTWLVPIETARWAPLEGMFYGLRGTENVSAEGKELAEVDVDPWQRTPPRLEAEPDGPVEQLWKLLDQAKVELDAMKRAGWSGR